MKIGMASAAPGGSTENSPGCSAAEPGVSGKEHHAPEGRPIPLRGVIFDGAKFAAADAVEG